MAIKSSGTLSLRYDIAAEINGQTSNISLRNLSSAVGFSSPDAMSEFYGYSAGPPPPPPGVVFGSFCYGSVNAKSIDVSSGKSFNGSFGSFFMFVEIFPWQGETWDWDIYGQGGGGDGNNFPFVSGLDISLSGFYGESSWFNYSFAGYPAPYFYNWTNAYYLGDAFYYDFYSSGYGYYLTPRFFGGGFNIGEARALAEYNLI